MKRSGARIRRASWFSAITFCVALSGCAASSASQPALDARLNEQIITLPVQVGNNRVDLETTIYKPPGPGPFPLLLMNHGKNPGNPHTQTRSRHLRLAAVFVQRGYMVAIPMREGFAGSGGHYPNDKCDSFRHGMDEANDALAALRELVKRPDVDRSRILIAGQSDGGLVTMALASRQMPGVKGLLNFSGGIRMKQCPDWQQRLVETYASYGKQARYPSLWFYGDNDELWPQPLPQQMFSAYHQQTSGAASNAKMVDIGVFGKNSHDFIDGKMGTQRWLPAATAFIHSLGLPFEPVVDLRSSHEATVHETAGAPQ